MMNGVRGVFVGAIAAGIVTLAVMKTPKLPVRTMAGCTPAEAGGIAKTVVDVGQLVGCILSHESEPKDQIVADCSKFGAITVADVDSVLEQHRAATARERAAGTLPACADAGK